MKRSQAYPTKHLSKDDIHAPVKATIHSVVSETLGQGEDQEIKPVMYFSTGVDKPMVINATNWMNVEGLYGDESDDWAGKPIEIWVDPSVSYGGKRIGGLRLRAPAPNGQPAEPKLADRASLLARFEQLRDKAASLKLTHPLALAPLPDTATEAEIVEAGKTLKAAIVEAENF